MRRNITENMEHHEKQVSSVNTLRESTDKKYKVNDIDICNATSTIDCTGLMPRPPLSEEETDSYHEVYTFGPPDVSYDTK